ncbi:SusC/RagA family TonB-linked outer membrane protein [Filimonas lacunae]|nr:SusC/RagA family TonB-linked outer membrane protein [Filimonas lacunae]BAV05045.1 outer membrane protein, nutrient binding [Filimonas lacunae]
MALSATQANVLSQTVTLQAKNISLERVLQSIEDQTGYGFNFDRNLLKGLKLLSVDVKNKTVKEVLDLCLKELPITYTITDDKKIFLKRKVPEAHTLEETSVPDTLITVTGLVTDSSGAPVEGASVTVKGSTKLSASTAANGRFQLSQVRAGDRLLIALVGYVPDEVTVTGAQLLIARLQPSLSKLDEVKIVAYGTTTERRNVGSVTTVKAETIERQPVADVLQALQSNVPGLVITQANGLAGSGYAKVEIRGTNSLASGSTPLFLVDGVQVAGADDYTAGINPFIAIGPDNIESISVLKDADATAIYGSRGANGVILITTKKGKAGQTRVNANVSAGYSRYTQAGKFLNTEQYLEMRREAFKNDGETPTTLTAPDLNGYGVGADVNRYTNWQDVMLKQGASITDAQLSMAGGNNQTTFHIGAGFHRETPPLPADNFYFQRPSLHANFSQTSVDRKFRVTLSANYSDIKSNYASGGDISYFAFSLPPNLPELKNADGSFNFIENMSNPYAKFAQPNRTGDKNLLASLAISYQLARGLTLKTNFGYTDQNKQSVSISPLATLSPQLGLSSGIGNFISILTNNWQVEPQLEYVRTIGRGRLAVLVGATWQQLQQNSSAIRANNYSSEAMLENYATAASVTVTPGYSNYKYAALFARLNYSYQDKYLLNLTARRDGSSRFGPGRQFGNFGAIGAGWIFSEENFIKMPWLSFGKLRASMGVTGNDQIGDYKYLSTYGGTTIAAPGGLAVFSGFTYNGIAAISPVALYNPDYSWETTRKYEIGLDMGFWKDRVLLNVSWFNNRSSSQLVNYSLPPTTGFNSILRNFPALIGNNGWEFTLNTVNVSNSKFSWNSALTLTIPRNKLLAFPNLASSSYASQYVIGQPLSVQKVFKYLGVDAATGTYVFADKDGKPTSAPTPNTDQQSLVNIDRKLFAGFTNTWRYGAWQLTIDMQYVRKTTFDNLTVTPSPAGGIGNYNVAVMDRWQKPGDHTNVQRFTQNTATDAYLAGYYVQMSERAYTGGSFMRVKNASLAWQLPANALHSLHSKGARIYLNAQNLFTFTSFKDNDPETGSGSVPPMRSIVAGIQCSF